MRIWPAAAALAIMSTIAQAEDRYEFLAAPQINLSLLYRLDRLTGDIVACQFARTPGKAEIGPGAYGVTACSRPGEGASGQPPGDYALYSGHNEQEGGVFRVDRRNGAVSVCYLRVERDKQGDAVTDSFVVCTAPFK
jgi:hypothetical protein